MAELEQFRDRWKNADISKGMIKELSALIALASTPPDVGDGRKIQEVLQLHVNSSESMRGTYVRVGTQLEERYQQGFTNGLKRAIEVAENHGRMIRHPTPSARN